MPSTIKKATRVRKGQIWMDGDRRARGERVLEVMRVRKTGVAVIRNQKTGKETEASLRRFNNYANGYVLLHETRPMARVAA